MEKFDLSDCSIVLPVQIDSVERFENIHFLFQYFEKYFRNHQLIVIEQGVEQKIQPHPNREIEFVNSGEEFSVSQICNRGASRVKNPFFCKYDADALINPRAIFNAFERLKRETGTSFILPYNGISLNIQNPLRNEIMQSFDVGSLPFLRKEDLDGFQRANMRIKNDDSTGLIHLFRTAVFRELGGYNEEFVGWGYEDEEVVARFDKLGHPRKILENYNAFHLDHPRKMGDSVQVFKNYYRYLVVKNMLAEDVLEYIKTWKATSSI